MDVSRWGLDLQGSIQHALHVHVMDGTNGSVYVQTILLGPSVQVLNEMIWPILFSGQTARRINHCAVQLTHRQWLCECQPS